MTARYVRYSRMNGQIESRCLQLLLDAWFAVNERKFGSFLFRVGWLLLIDGEVKCLSGYEVNIDACM